MLQIIPIGLAGYLGTGKSTVAKALKLALDTADTRQRCCVGSFAAPLKELCVAQFAWDGNKDTKGRALLQTIGCAARAYDADFWVKKLHESTMTLAGDIARNDSRANRLHVLIDDIRFANEAAWVKKGGFVVFLRAPWATAGEHESEQFDITTADYVIDLVENQPGLAVDAILDILDSRAAAAAESAATAEHQSEVQLFQEMNRRINDSLNH